jgi:triacylglycerol esterase/lipase EstA (alpha/beta hydrolase family)
MKTLLSTLFILLINLVATAQQSLTATIQYNNIAATGDYTIISNDAITMSQVDKPLIIVEGFDPTNEISVSNIASLFNRPTGNMLGEQLRNEGYDIIILNFANGGDYIQRNAFLLIELINQINTSKTGNEQLVICGVSMGGLVARYALTYMEHHSLNHNTRLFISFDAPNKGAYIPISLQYLLKVHSNFSQLLV